MNDETNFRDYMWNKDSNGPSRSECTKRGCRKLETRCLDCGHAVNKITIPVIEREWISTNIAPKDEQQILVTNGEEIRLTYYNIWDNGPSWGCPPWFKLTHWMPLPEPPKD